MSYTKASATHVDHWHSSTQNNLFPTHMEKEGENIVVGMGEEVCIYSQDGIVGFGRYGVFITCLK